MKGKVLALDYGIRHVGVASGDFERGIAFPRDVFENNALIFERIEGICVELEVNKVIIGLPLNMDESHAENPVMRKVRDFAANLEKRFEGKGIEVELFDERLSSFEASEMTGKSGKSRKENLDAYAAQIILQRYFDKFNV